MNNWITDKESCVSFLNELVFVNESVEWMIHSLIKTLTWEIPQWFIVEQIGSVNYILTHSLSVACFIFE